VHAFRLSIFQKSLPVYIDGQSGGIYPPEIKMGILKSN